MYEDEHLESDYEDRYLFPDETEDDDDWDIDDEEDDSDF